MLSIDWEDAVTRQAQREEERGFYLALGRDRPVNGKQLQATWNRTTTRISPSMQSTRHFTRDSKHNA